MTKMHSLHHDVDILRDQFDWAAERARARGHHDVASCFDNLTATVKSVPAPIVHSYFEFFEDCGDAESDVEQMDKIRFLLWSPANATEYLEKYIAVASGSS